MPTDALPGDRDLSQASGCDFLLHINGGGDAEPPPDVAAPSHKAAPSARSVPTVASLSIRSTRFDRRIYGYFTKTPVPECGKSAAALNSGQVVEAPSWEHTTNICSLSSVDTLVCGDPPSLFRNRVATCRIVAFIGHNPESANKAHLSVCQAIMPNT